MFDFEAINIRHGTNLYKSTKRLFSIVKSVTQVVPDKKNEKKRLKCENDKFGDAGESKTKGSSSSNLKKSHGILNMLGWGIIIPIGAMVARYMKPWDPVWFYSHSLLQSLGFLFGVSGIVCGFVLENRLGVDVDKHKSLGVFILTLGCLQVIAFLARADKESKVRKYWNWYHYGLGRALIILAVANVFYGIHLGDAGSGWNAGYAVVVCLLFLVAVILEVRLWMTD